MQRLLSELKRRNVVRVGIAYGVVAWLLIQLAGALEPALLLPDWVDRVVIVFLLIGFPIVLIFAWAFEITPEGLKLTREVDPAQSITGHTGKKLEYITIGLLALVVVVFVAREVWLEPHARPVATAAVPASIAVMPFLDFSAAKDQAYFSNGIAEEILNLLARTNALRVAARTSSFALADSGLSIPEIGKSLDVDTVLEGSVRTSGDKIRVTAQLINVADGYHLWSDTYDRDNTDVFTIQDEIAGKIMEALRVHLLPGEQADVTATAEREIDLDAYHTYLVGRERLAQRTTANIVAAKEKFGETLETEPDYAPAHVGIAYAETLLEEWTYGGDREFSDESKTLVEQHLARAVELDADLPEAIGVQGYYYLMTNRFDEAEAALNRAIDLNPSYAQAYSWRADTAYEQERFLDMLADKEKAYALDPVSLQISAELAREYISFWRPEDAERVIERMFALHPHHPLAYDTAIHNYFAHGRSGEALITTEEALAKHPDDKNLREWQSWLLLKIGLFKDAEEIGTPMTQFYAKLLQGNHAGAKAVLDAHIADEGEGDWYSAARDYLRLAEEGPANPLFAEYLQQSIASFEKRNLDWQHRCLLFTIKDLRDTGYDGETESMMQECGKQFEERLKAKYLCPCSFYAAVLYTILDGRIPEAVERADQWLSQGDSSAYLPYEATFRELSDHPSYPDLIARNETQLERQRQIYFAGRAPTKSAAHP